MSLKPIIGHDGSTPVLEKYLRSSATGLRPVLLVSPRPYNQWTKSVLSNDYGTVTTGFNWARIDSEVLAPGPFIAADSNIEMRMFSTGPACKIRATLSCGGDFPSGSYVFIYLAVDATTEDSAILEPGGTTSVDLVVPYYRFRVFVYFSVLGGNTDPPTQVWMRVDFSMV